MKTVISATTVNSANANSVAVQAPIVPKTEPVADDEQSMDFQTPNTTSTPNANKRPAFLDLNKSSKNKRALGPLLTDIPDLEGGGLNTPEVQTMILSLQTPDQSVFPSKVSQVTTEQMEFVNGFDKALEKLRTSKSSRGYVAPVSSDAITSTTMTTVNNGNSGGTIIYNNMDVFPTIKDEQQTVTASPTVSPIDMESQEKIKLERKRQRNRVAASKCRKRKLERISKLEDRVKILKGENTDLAGIVKNLKDHVAQLKQQVIEHTAAGCTVQTIPNAVLLSSK